MEMTRTLQQLLDQVVNDPTIVVTDEYTDDDSSNTIVMCDNSDLDQQYEDIMSALQYYLDPILIEEIGGNKLPGPGPDGWCLMPGYPDPESLLHYSHVVQFLGTLMQTVKGQRPLISSVYSDRTIDRAYYSLQQLNPSDGVVQLYNECLNTMLSCIP